MLASIIVIPPSGIMCVGREGEGKVLGGRAMKALGSARMAIRVSVSVRLEVALARLRQFEPVARVPEPRLDVGLRHEAQLLARLGGVALGDADVAVARLAVLDLVLAAEEAHDRRRELLHRDVPPRADVEDVPCEALWCWSTAKHFVRSDTSLICVLPVDGWCATRAAPAAPRELPVVTAVAASMPRTNDAAAAAAPMRFQGRSGALVRSVCSDSTSAVVLYVGIFMIAPASSKVSDSEPVGFFAARGARGALLVPRARGHNATLRECSLTPERTICES